MPCFGDRVTAFIITQTKQNVQGTGGKFGHYKREDRPMGNIYGYIRVSSTDQNEDRQLIAMKEMQVSEENIFIDKQSGKDFNRPQYKQLLRRPDTSLCCRWHSGRKP